MAVDYKAEALRMASGIGGGALAGALDVQFPSTKPLGLPVGAVVGIGMVAAGIAGASSKYKGAAGHIGDIGIGMLAAEAGFATVSRMVAAKQAAAQTATPAVAGLRSVPSIARGGSQQVSAAAIRDQIAALRRAA